MQRIELCTSRTPYERSTDELHPDLFILTDVIAAVAKATAAMTETQLSQSGGESEDDQSLFAVEEAVD